MNLALWILQGLLAAAFAMGGLSKIFTPREKLLEKMEWVRSYSPEQVKLIGLAELLGAIGLTVPWLTGIAPVLTPLAALGLMVIMLGAVGTHLKLKDGHFTPAAVLALLTALVALGRF